MKKLLLILIALPMIGFGQDDKIIFSSGDTIIGKVIEVGVNDITYQHKNETTNNISKKRALAKVIYSSVRIETFDGLQILERNQVKEAENLGKERRKHQMKELSKKRKNLYFQVGVNQFIPSTAAYSIEGGYVARTGFSSKTSYQVYINENISYIPSVAFHFISFENEYPISIGGNDYNRSLLSIGNEIEYNINNRFYVSSGVSFDILLKANNPHNNLVFGDMIDSQQGFISSNIEDDSRKDLGYYSSFTLNLKYILNQEGKIRYFIFSDYKIPFYYSNQPEEITFGGLPMQRRQFNFQLNTTISFGVGANF